MAPFAANAIPEKMSRKLFEEQKTAVSKIFIFRNNYYNSADNTMFLARLIFSSFANVGQLMTNDDALES